MVYYAGNTPNPTPKPFVQLKLCSICGLYARSSQRERAADEVLRELETLAKQYGFKLSSFSQELGVKLLDYGSCPACRGLGELLAGLELLGISRPIIDEVKSKRKAEALFLETNPEKKYNGFSCWLCHFVAPRTKRLHPGTKLLRARWAPSFSNACLCSACAYLWEKSRNETALKWRRAFEDYTFGVLTDVVGRPGIPNPDGGVL